MIEVGTFIMKHWRIIAVAVLVAAVGTQTLRLRNAKGDLAEARAALINPLTKKTWQSEALRDARDLATCRGNVKTLDQAVTAQNASIDNLKAEADAAKARASAAVRAAQSASEGARRDAAGIMGRRPSGDLCASALELLREP